MRTLRLAILLACGALSARAALTTVTDVIHKADGGFCAGTIGLSWPQFIDASNGNTIYAGSTSVKVATNGSFSVNLAWGSVVFTGTTTLNSTTVAVANTSNLAVGYTVVAAGLSSLPATTIVSIVTNTSITVSQKATASGTVSMTALTGGGVYTANYNLTPASCAISTERWLVPVSASPVGLSAVRTVMQPPPPALNFIGYGAFSFALVPPSWLTAVGSPIIDTGTITLTPTTGQTSHRVIGTCGSATTFAPCALVAADLPAIPASQITGVLGVPSGGTAKSSLTAYAVMAGGTTTTGAVQQVSGLGTSGQVLTSNGAGALPTWQTGGGGGANTALSNLSMVSVNASLAPQTTLSLGDSTHPWQFAYLYGAGTYGGNNFKLTGTPTGARTVTFPDSTGTVFTTASRSGNTAEAVTTTGTQTATAVVNIDASGNHVASLCTIDSSGNQTCPGGYSSGASGNSGLELFGGATSGTAGLAAPATVGTNIVYLLPGTSGTAGQVLSDNGSVTCPSFLDPSAPTLCHQMLWTASGGGGSGSLLAANNVPTVESTASPTFTTLTTPDSITFSLSGTTSVVVSFQALMANSNALLNGPSIRLVIDGTPDTATENAFYIGVPSGGAQLSTLTNGIYSLAAGSHTISVQYETSGFSTTWQNRLLTAFAL